MAILGVYPSHDSGAALVDWDGRLLSAINEGRLIDEKLYWGFPEESIPTVLEIADLDPSDVDVVAFGGRNPAIGKREAFDEIPPKKRLMEYLSYLPGTGTRTFGTVGRRIFDRLRDDSAFEDHLSKLEIEAPVRFYDHHRCHAASAYYTSQFDSDTLIVTIDAQGDFRSATVSTVDREGTIHRRSWTPFYHSLGKFWSYVTFNLGFTPMRHEGKIAGLAAHGDPDECLDVFRRYLQVDSEQLRFRSNLALAGGVFANVQLNQRLLELDCVDEIYVHPHMGDGGLAVGAAYLHWASSPADRTSTREPRWIGTAYKGNEQSDAAIESALEAAGLGYESPDDPHRRAGDLVAAGYVVGRYNGRLEYGPRALGNRSILALPTDPSCQDWLNDRLDRTEFMPFAPSILADDADAFFTHTNGGALTGKFMTITFDVTQRAEQAAPGVVHVDGTARPQLVTEDDNPTYYRLLERVREKTGLPLVLNTSFNTHGDPIVNDPEDAIRAYENGIVDALAIGEYVVFDEDTDPSIAPVEDSELLAVES